MERDESIREAVFDKKGLLEPEHGCIKYLIFLEKTFFCSEKNKEFDRF